MTRKKAFNSALIFALLACTMLSMVGFSDSCTEMYDNIIRIRIIANSDSDEDQLLKLKIRDAVLNESTELFGETTTYEDAVTTTVTNLDALCSAAQKEVLACGFNYSVKAEFREEFFDTRVYDDFTLPAGNYRTAVFTVGEGNGKNWWCVIFPQVCVGSCSGELNEVLSESSADIAYKRDKYVIRFKTVEIFEKIKNYLDF